MLAAITVATSCDSTDTKPTYSTFVTVVEGSWDVPYYVVFDDGVTAYVENYKVWTPSFTDEWRELRYIIYFTETELTQPGYDKVINLSAYQPISVTKLTNATSEDFTKKDGLNQFSATMDIQDAYYTPARNYITMSVLIPFNDPSVRHEVKVVLNSTENGPYKQMYEDDDYLWLEAYHNDKEDSDSDSEQAATYLSLKVNEQELGIENLQTSYRGIKVLYKSHANNGNLSIYELDFHKEE